MFDLAGWILRALPRVADRKLFLHRVLFKLHGVRRGRLRLPRDFPPEVRALSELTTSQLRQTVYANLADDRVTYRADSSVINFVHQVMPDGRLRTVNVDNAVHVWQRKHTRVLPQQDWPRLGTRPAWPSSPSIMESIEMARRGLVALPVNKKRRAVENHIRLSELNGNAELRARIVAKNVLAIRSDVKVPAKWLGHFHYRWNFLILTGSYKMPVGLVRFLIGQWARNPHNLWLQDKTSFKSYLKKTDRARFPCFHPGPW